MGVLDLNDGKKKVMKLKKDEICIQGFRIDLNGKMVRGVPHRNKMTATDFVILILVIHYNVLTARAYGPSLLE